jgi:ubiquinone/menaquinone biosynthesis C-methylase UbiE
MPDSKHMESFYQKAISKMNISPDRLKLGKIEELDYPENHFDFITFSVVLEHLYDPSYCIQRALKWLKPGGIIHIEVPSSNYFMNKLYNASYSIRGLDYVGNLSPMHSPFHLYEFDINSFKKNSAQNNNNYSIALHQYYVCETGLPEPINFALKKYMSLSNSSMQLCVWLKKS